MPKIQQVRTIISLKNRRKEYVKHTLVIPNIVLKLLEWKAGDEITFDLNKEGLVDGSVKMRKIIIR